MNTIIRQPQPIVRRGTRLTFSPIIVVLAVWAMCAIAVVAAGCLDGSVLGTFITLFAAVDAAIFTKGYLQ